MVPVHRRRLLQLAGGLAAGLSGCTAMAPDHAARRALADHVVADARELESTFEGLSPGETVLIERDGAPYRTREWLDVDVDGVTVLGPGVEELIKPADGANVGGIRVGHNAHCEGVTVAGVGYHGNPSGQRDAAWRLHGIVVRDAANVTIERNAVTRTHPYHEHNFGGSGISVERGSENVRVANNYVHDIGDRGIQLAGDGIVVSGNLLVDGFDRSVAFDAWSPDGVDYQARNVTVTGNVMGNNPEGSLTGIGGGSTRLHDRGYVTIAGNVGFGRHKSLCHVGGDGDVGNVQIQGNVSVQAGDNDIAGVSVDITHARRVAVRDNVLSGYSGRGINLAGDIGEFVVADNGVYDAGLAGVRVAGARFGVVRGNYVTGTAEPGILLDDTRSVTVESNRVRRADRSAIVTRNADEPTRNAIVGNHVEADDRDADRAYPAILVQDSGNVVRGNRVVGHGAAAIAEADGVAENVFERNWADGDAPWRFAGPTSTVRGNTPETDVHRGLAPDEDGVVEVSFDLRYARRPKLTFGRVGGGVREVAYTTDGDGNVDGAEIVVAAAGGTVDVFVEDVP